MPRLMLVGIKKGHTKFAITEGWHRHRYQIQRGSEVDIKPWDCILTFWGIANESLDKWHGKLTTRCGGTVVVSVVVYSPNDTQVTSVASVFPHVLHATELQAIKK